MSDIIGKIITGDPVEAITRMLDSMDTALMRSLGINFDRVPKLALYGTAGQPIMTFDAGEVTLDPFTEESASLTLRFGASSTRYPIIFDKPGKYMEISTFECKVARWRTGGSRARRAVVRRVRK